MPALPAIEAFLRRAPYLHAYELGNIATRPDARDRGHAGCVNVRADNAAAIACYRRVGFEARHAYDEWRAASPA